MHQNKNILVVAYYWPPASSPGVQRWLKFTKYLAKLGFNIIVVTTDNGSYPNVDNSLLKDVPENIKVIKTKSIEPILLYNLLQGKAHKKLELGMVDIKEPKSFLKRFARKIRSELFIPDAKIGWYYNARKKILDICKKEKIDTVITTGPPQSTHLFGLYVKSKIDIKWITDFRDPWTKIYYEDYLVRSKRAKKKNLELEKSVCKSCDHIITINKGMYDDFIPMNSNITLIPNGFDQEDFESINTSKIPTKKFQLLYTGNFKLNQNIHSLYQAIAEIRKSNLIFKQKFEFKIIGNLNAEVQKTIESYGISDCVKFENFKPHDEIVLDMVHTNLLYLPIPRIKENKSMLTGKIFEYMASTTPILSIGPTEGEASKILQAVEADQMVDYDDTKGVIKLLLKQFNYWIDHEGYSQKSSNDLYLNYSRENLTKKLVELL